MQLKHNIMIYCSRKTIYNSGEGKNEYISERMKK